MRKIWPFLEHLADRVVDGAGALAALADRLLDDDAGLRRDQAVPADALADRAEQVRADGEIEGADAVGMLGEHGGEIAASPPRPSRRA